MDHRDTRDDTRDDTRERGRDAELVSAVRHLRRLNRNRASGVDWVRELHDAYARGRADPSDIDDDEARVSMGRALLTGSEQARGGHRRGGRRLLDQ